MTRAGEKMLAGAREALAVARGDFNVIKGIRVTPSCGCVFCDLDFVPVKMKRQWIHHSPRSGSIAICLAKSLKPGS